MRGLGEVFSLYQILIKASVPAIILSFKGSEFAAEVPMSETRQYILYNSMSYVVAYLLLQRVFWSSNDGVMQSDAYLRPWISSMDRWAK